MFVLVLLTACEPTADADDSAPEWVDNACGRWSGLQDERAWTYTWSEGAAVVGDWTTTLGRFDGVSGRMTTQGSTIEPKVTRDYTDEVEFTCDDGFQLLSVSSVYAGLNEGEAYSGSTVTVYDPPVHVWPAEASDGDMWDAEYVGTVKVDGGKPTAFAYTVHNEVLAPEQLELPAGDFRAFAVRQTTGEGESASVTRVFVAAEFGVVKGQAYELTALR